jgi:methionyl aminopeptidase
MGRKLQSNDPCWCGSGRKYKRCHNKLDQLAASGRVIPGQLSPLRPVPPHILRPPYAQPGANGNPGRGDGEPQVHDAESLPRMRAACQAAAEILVAAGELVKPGVRTDEIDEFVHQACIDRGGYPSPLGYAGSGGSPPFPKSVCTSVNEVICHGIPDDRVLQDGDICDIDVTIYLDGFHGDTNATFCAGDVDETSRNLIRVTRECTERGIAQVRPGGKVIDIGRAIQEHAHAHGLSVVRAFVGHGVGRRFHGAPTVFHYPEPRAEAFTFHPGMTFTVEPMIALGTGDHTVWPDGWTAVTRDHRRAAQFEHTVLVTDTGVEVLTVPAEGPAFGRAGAEAGAAT